MTAIEDAREQAREALPGVLARLVENRLGKSLAREADKDMIALRAAANAIVALLDATEPSTVAVKTEFRVLDAPKDCDYHEGFEEGIKVGRAGSGPRPITDEMVERAISAHRFTNAFGPEEVTRMRAALEAAEEARR